MVELVFLFGQDDKPGGSIVIGKGSTATVLDSAGLCVKKVSIYNIDENGKKTGTIAGHLGYVESNFGSWENINSQQGIGLMSSEKIKIGDTLTPKHILKVTDVHIGATDGTAYWYIKDGEWSFATKAIVEDETLITGITCKPGEITIKAPESNTSGKPYTSSEPGAISLKGAEVLIEGAGGSILITNIKAIDTPNEVSISANDNEKLSLSTGANGQLSISTGAKGKLSLSGDILTITNGAFDLSYNNAETALKVNVNTLNLTGITGLDIKSGDALNLTGNTINLDTKNAGEISLQGTTVKLASVLKVEKQLCTISNLEVQNTLKVTHLTVAENGTTTGVYATLK